MPEPLLDVRHLTARFRTRRGMVTAVDDVSFELYPGETLGIVGESGCGKTVTSKSIMRLLPEHTSELSKESTIMFRGHNLATLPRRRMRHIRGGQIAMIFQEPMTSLNPVFTIGWQIEEALRYHTKLNRAGRRLRTIEMLELVELSNPQRRIHEYPCQLSGGMRQRVMIAIALSCSPDILIADEPTTALDVTIQAQILRLMEDLKVSRNTSMMLITHDMGVVAQVCDRVMIMYAGRVIETGTVFNIFKRPKHPYTKALLDSIPHSDQQYKGKKLPTIEGMVPSLFHMPKGCRFADRCGVADETCHQREPDLIATQDPGHWVRCHRPLQGDLCE